MAVKTPVVERAAGRRKEAAKGHALPDGSFPIPNVAYLKKAIKALGRAKDRRRALAHIKKRARELGREDLVRHLTLSEITLVSSKVYPGLDKSPKENWVDKAGGLPSYIERIAKHLHYEKGMSISHAIATAVNVVKKMCAGGDLNFPGSQKVNAGSRAQACAAVAQWEKKKAGTRVKTTDIHGRKLSDFEFAEIISSVGYKRLDFV